MAAEDDELLTVDEVARRLKVHPETVRRWLRADQLRGVQFGGKRTGYRIRMSDLQLFISGDK
jgi:excisionase family DNA binding protein